MAERRGLEVVEVMKPFECVCVCDLGPDRYCDLGSHTRIATKLDYLRRGTTVLECGQGEDHVPMIDLHSHGPAIKTRAAAKPRPLTSHKSEKEDSGNKPVAGRLANGNRYCTRSCIREPMGNVNLTS